MIKARNIHKSYGNLEVLKGVDIHIKVGEVVSIVGESGAGKSTLLADFRNFGSSYQSGKYDTEIAIAGESFINMNDKQLSKFRNQNIGFVFQFHQLLPDLLLWKTYCFLQELQELMKEKLLKKHMLYLKTLRLSRD
jgi:lipoprotein-releasing system ATP-binding protein